MSASKNGIPDIFAKKGSRSLFFEVKTDTGRLSPLQVIAIDRLNDGLECAYMVRSLDDVKAVLSASVTSKLSAHQLK